MRRASHTAALLWDDHGDGVRALGEPERTGSGGEFGRVWGVRGGLVRSDVSAPRRRASAGPRGPAGYPVAVAPQVLDQRALNRALLARQMLLERQHVPVVEAVEHLVALQAQVPVDPYVCLWSRLDGFAGEQLSGLLAERAVVRASLLRCTIHLTSGRDALAIWPLLRAVLERGFYSGSPFGRRLAGMDVAPLLALGRKLIDEKPRTRAELRPLLAAEWPDRDRDSLVYALAYLEPLVQIPPRGLWGRSGQPTWARTETWLAAPLETQPSIDRLVLRYLEAFGPASVPDAQEWSGLTRLKDVFERLRPGLLAFRNETGRELFDLPDAPRPDPDTPAPIRFLPQYDNVLLGHADRSRIIPDAVRGVSWPVVWVGPFLVDGLVSGTWRIESIGSLARIELSPFTAPPATQRDELADEARRLLEFLRPAARSREVRFA